MGNEHNAIHHGHSSVSASFTELWNPGWIVFTIIIGIVYFLLITKYRDRFTNSEAVPFKRKAWFVFGLLLLYVAQGSPLSYYGHHFLFSAHMLQMSISFLTVPLLILYGMPKWLLRPLLLNPYMKKPFQFFTTPLIAILLFNGLFSIYHLPIVFNTVMTNPILHTITHLILMVTAFMMWWPIMCPIEEIDYLSPLKKIGYIFASGVLLTPACALIIFAGTVLYAPYISAPQLFSMLPVLEDQQLGGVIMKIVQEIVYGSILGYIFVNWFRREREQEDLEYDKMTNSEPNPNLI